MGGEMTEARELGKRRGYKQVIVLCVDDGDALEVSSWGRNDDLDDQIAVIGDEAFDVVWHMLQGDSGEE